MTAFANDASPMCHQEMNYLHFLNMRIFQGKIVHDQKDNPR